EEKLKTLNKIEGLDSLQWYRAPDGWQDPFVPMASGEYASWPLITDIFPWQHSGVQVKRTWPIGPTREVLEQRWEKLVSSSPKERALLFKESGDRKINKSYPAIFENKRLKPISQLNIEDQPEKYERYGYRSLIRTWIIADGRVISRPRVELWATQSDEQIYLTSHLTKPLGRGPALIASANVPDMDYFAVGGGKDIIPLWKDPHNRIANLTRGLIEKLSELYGVRVSPEDVFAYVYSVLAHPAYTEQFWEELRSPPPRVPLTKRLDLFQKAVKLGRRLLCFHTYGERFRDSCVLSGRASRVELPRVYPYPDSFSYERKTCRLRVGIGYLQGVRPEVWDYEVSGLYPLRKWLSYHKKNRRGRKSSLLDDIEPEEWTPELGLELTHLIWILENTIELNKQQDQLLKEILQGPLIKAEELPRPSGDERRPPSINRERRIL
ncbi:MAG: DNA methyltransferase, partial [Thermotogae bacterium]|nr:DNA methyltransferase [Thermotogota bacterium]